MYFIAQKELLYVQVLGLKVSSNYLNEAFQISLIYKMRSMFCYVITSLITTLQLYTCIIAIHIAIDAFVVHAQIAKEF